MKHKIQSRIRAWWMIIALLLLGVAAAAGFRLSAQAAADLFAALGADRTEVTAGEPVAFTMELRNEGDVRLTDILLAPPAFPAGLAYTAGTARLLKNGSEATIPEQWLSEYSNLGALDPGQSAQVSYSATIAADAAAGTALEVINQVKPTELSAWVSRAEMITVMAADATTRFQTGNILTGTNNTRGPLGWSDPVHGNIGDIVEFRLLVANEGSHPARNATIQVHLPLAGQAAASLSPTATVRADNAPEAGDALAVSTTDSAFMNLYVGHATIFGNTDLYPNCQNGCPLSEWFVNGPLGIGKVDPGQSNSVQITFKATLTGIGVPSPTLTPEPTITIAPTTSPMPTGAVTTTPEPTATLTPEPTGTVAPTPTQAVVIPSPPPAAQPVTGFPVAWLGIITVLGVLIKLLLRG